ITVDRGTTAHAITAVDLGIIAHIAVGDRRARNARLTTRKVAEISAAFFAFNGARRTAKQGRGPPDTCAVVATVILSNIPSGSCCRDGVVSWLDSPRHCLLLK